MLYEFFIANNAGSSCGFLSRSLMSELIEKQMVTKCFKANGHLLTNGGSSCSRFIRSLNSKWFKKQKDMNVSDHLLTLLCALILDRCLN